MKKKCFIDKNIILSNECERKLYEFDLEYIDLNDENINHREIEYLLMHSFIKNENLSKMEYCKYIGIRAHNTDYVNKVIAESFKITVEGLKKQHGINGVAEHTFSLIMALAKNILRSHNNTTSGRWREGLSMNFELRGKTLGIVGNGKIGKRVGEIGDALGMKVTVAGRENNMKEGEVPIEEVLKSADIVTIHISSKKENINFINREKLGMMKDNAILINTARGTVLDYEALEDELKKGRFLGVGLDVFPEEPVIKSYLFDYDNVIMTPHMAYLTQESINNMNNELIENFLKYTDLKRGI